jgi:hypothetical protein
MRLLTSIAVFVALAVSATAQVNLDDLDLTNITFTSQAALDGELQFLRVAQPDWTQTNWIVAAPAETP